MQFAADHLCYNRTFCMERQPFLFVTKSKFYRSSFWIHKVSKIRVPRDLLEAVVCRKRYMLTYFRLNKLQTHTLYVYWKSRIPVLGMPGYTIKILQEKKWPNYFQTMETLIKRHILISNYPFRGLQTKIIKYHEPFLFLILLLLF